MPRSYHRGFRGPRHLWRDPRPSPFYPYAPVVVAVAAPDEDDSKKSGWTTEEVSLVVSVASFVAIIVFLYMMRR